MGHVRKLSYRVKIAHLRRVLLSTQFQAGEGGLLFFWLRFQVRLLECFFQLNQIRGLPDIHHTLLIINPHRLQVRIHGRVYFPRNRLLLRLLLLLLRTHLLIQLELNLLLRYYYLLLRAHIHLWDDVRDLQRHLSLHLRHFLQLFTHCQLDFLINFSLETPQNVFIEHVKLLRLACARSYRRACGVATRIHLEQPRRCLVNGIPYGLLVEFLAEGNVISVVVRKVIYQQMTWGVLHGCRIGGTARLIIVECRLMLHKSLPPINTILGLLDGSNYLVVILIRIWIMLLIFSDRLLINSIIIEVPAFSGTRRTIRIEWCLQTLICLHFPLNKKYYISFLIK